MANKEVKPSTVEDVPVKYETIVVLSKVPGDEIIYLKAIVN